MNFERRNLTRSDTLVDNYLIFELIKNGRTYFNAQIDFEFTD
jgi:hypothetical protein